MPKAACACSCEKPAICRPSLKVTRIFCPSAWRISKLIPEIRPGEPVPVKEYLQFEAALSLLPALPPEEAATVTKALAAEGLYLTELRADEADLETVFLELTGEHPMEGAR